jgi:hypothetical protein
MDEAERLVQAAIDVTLYKISRRDPID